MTQLTPIHPQGGDITLVQIINFLADSWKKLLSAALFGVFLGLAGWFLLGEYSAEYILLNNTNINININTNTNTNTNTNNNANTYALDIVSWKTIQKSLPNLASQILGEVDLPRQEVSLYKDLSEERWWQKNVIPSYAISKADTKDLAGISKDLDAASTTILSLTVNAAGGSRQSSIDNVRVASRFLRTGGAYLQLRNILNSYEGETISAAAEIQKKITTTEIEIGFQIQRAKALEDLHKRFPGNASLTSQVVDPKDSGAKYLPISTQIIAVNNDINQSKESLQRLRDRLVQIGLIKNFLDEAIPLTEKTFDGLALDEELLNIEMKLRSKLAKDDVKSKEILDQLHAQLLQVQARFTKGLEANTAPTSKKTGMIKCAVGGLLATFSLVLLFLLGQRALLGMKKNESIG